MLHQHTTLFWIIRVVLTLIACQRNISSIVFMFYLWRRFRCKLDLGWDYEKCCGYDFDTDQCREVESRPFSFGNVCEECEIVDINENEGEETDDCSTDPSCPFYSDHSVRTTPAFLAGAVFTLIAIMCYVYRRKDVTNATEVTTNAQSEELDEECNRPIET